MKPPRKFAPVPNARFWEYIHDGWVKLTLRPGQGLSHWHGAPDDEGYSREENSWAHLGDHVTNVWHFDARDCDGRISRSGASQCPLDRLQQHPAVIGDWRAFDLHPPDPNIYSTTLLRPAWQKLNCRQRDYSAEAAGY